MTTAKILDLVDYVADNAFVTCVDIAEEFDIPQHDAAVLLESLPFDSTGGASKGVYAVLGTTEEFLAKLSNPDQLISDRLNEVRGSLPPDYDFQVRVLDSLDDVRRQLSDLLEVHRMSATQSQPSGRRRRRRGELLQPRIDDTPELAALRRKAEVEIGQSKAAGDKEHAKVYARWIQRISALERRLGIGIYSNESGPDSSGESATQ